MKNRSIAPAFCVFLICCSYLLVTCKPPVDPNPPPALPAAPANVRVVAQSGDNYLAWDAVSGANSYNVYFSSDGSTYGSAASGLAMSQYLLPNYGYYEVSAVNSVGEGSRSSAFHHVPSLTAVATPTFSPAAGNYDTAQDISISTTTPSATIYYTTDGTTPSVATSLHDSVPVHVAIGETVTVKAIAVADGYSNSDEAAGTFHVTGWAVVGSAGFSGARADYVSLAIDSSGTPYVAYMDYSTSPQYKATVEKFDGSSWTTVGSAGFSAGAAPWTSIAVGGTGIPYVAFKDNSAGGKATVMRYSGGSWAVLGSSAFSLGTYIYGSLAVFSSSGTDYPYVSFQDGGSSSYLTVMQYSGSPGSWTDVGSVGFSAGQVFRTSMVVAPDASPIVAFMDNTTTVPNKATVKQFTSGAWVTIPSGGEGFSAGAIDYPSLAVTGSASAYTPYVAYQDGANSNKATVKCYSAGAWNTVPSGGEGFSSGSAGWTCLALDGSGTPWVAFSDGASSGKATVMKFDGSAWVVVGNAGFTSDLASYLSFAIDGNGTPYLAYQDAAAGNKVTVMRYK